MADVTSWLPNLLGPIKILINGVLANIPRRSTFNLIGTGLTAVDNPSNDRTDITFPIGGVPSGTGFSHITGGTQDGAARAVNLASADVTGVLPTANGGYVTPTASGFLHITGGTQDGAARAVNLNSADVTGVLPSANGGFHTVSLTTDVSGVLPTANQAAQLCSGDVTGTTAATVVAKINGTTVSSAGGALTTGKVLRVTGVSSCDYGAVDLANSNAVTGTLPTGNQASQAMGGSCAGTTASCTVVQIDGASGNCPITCNQTTWGTAPNEVLSQRGTVTTTNSAAATTILTIALPNAGTYKINVEVVASNTAGTSIGEGGWSLRAVYHSTGTTFSVDVAWAAIDTALSAGATLPTPTVTTSGTNFIVQVAGGASATYKWHAFAQVTGAG